MAKKLKKKTVTLYAQGLPPRQFEPPAAESLLQKSKLWSAEPFPEHVPSKKSGASGTSNDSGNKND